MTALPEPPGQLLTIAEYAALGEDDRYRWELQEGNLVMSPSPTPRHMIASGELRDQIKQQLPPHLRVIQDVDIDLQLAPPDQPGVSRRPDLIVVDQRALDRVDADAGIPHYWIVDLEPPVTLLACHLAGEFGYQDAGAVTGELITDEPAELKISLDQLS